MSHANPRPSVNSRPGTNPRPSTTKRPKLHPGATEGTSKYLAKISVLRTAIIIALLTGALGVTMCMSNILATKLWHLGPIHLDGGFLLFPLTYVIGDVLVELFYRKVADLITFFCCAINFLAYLAMRFTVFLPATSGTTQIEPGLVLGLSARIMIASAIATVLSTIVNNHIYDYMRRYESTHAVSEKAIKRRAWVSSFFAHIPDSLFFTLTAFAGMASFSELVHQMVTSYLAGIAVETLFLPVTGRIAFTLRRYLDEYLYSDAEA